jgi:addiction module HigA family antidote
MIEYSIKRPLKRPPIHPGEILREDVLPALGLSVSEAARRLGVSRQQLHRVLAGTHPITTEMALRIGKFAGNGPALWLRLQQAHDLWHTERRMKSELTKIEPEKEAQYWDREIAKEKAEQTARLLDKAEPFCAHRPPR